MRYENLLRNDQKVLDTIIRFKIATNGLSPTRKQIAEEIGLRSSTVVAISLNRLERYGFLLSTPIPRGIIIAGSKWEPPQWYLDARGENKG